MTVRNTCPKCGTDAHYLFEGETQCPDCDQRDFEAPILAALSLTKLPTELAERPAGTCCDCYDRLVCSMDENYCMTLDEAGVDSNDHRVYDIIRMLAHAYAADEARHGGLESLCTRCEDQLADRTAATNAAEHILFHHLDSAIEAETAGDLDTMRAHLDTITRAAKAMVIPVADYVREEIATYAADLAARYPHTDPAITAAQDAGFLF
jgi:hypothetical protein